MPEAEYVPPEVWTWDPDSPVGFKSNRPIAGATHETELPRGKHPFQLYSLGTPNGQKVTILFEELLAAGFGDAEYDAWLIDIMNGDQFGSGFVSVNPNSKIPGLLDCSGPEPIRVFESGAILLHLAEKFGAFIPSRRQGPRRMPVVADVADVHRAGHGRRLRPFLHGGADAKIEYAINRYAMETKRIFDVADRRLAEARFLAGDDYSIADMAVYRLVPLLPHAATPTTMAGPASSTC
jgi:GST-like protein